MKKSNRLQRIIHLLGLLQGGRPHSATSLAEACGVSRRTIFRDLEELRGAEVPLVYDDLRQVYSIPSQYFLAPTRFSLEEARAIVILCHELGEQDHLPFLQAARSAAVKIENSLSHSLRASLRAYADAVQIRLGCMNPLAGYEETFSLFLEAIGKRQAVRLRYESYAEQKCLQTKFHPYRLVFNLHSWYVVGRSTLHREVRTLNICRVKNPELLEEAFEPPRGFNLERYFGNAWRMIPETGPDTKAVIRFAPMVAKNVAEVVWHKNQSCEFESDGSLRYEVLVSGLHEISWWILGYGAQAEVLEPPALRDMIHQQAKRLLAKYEPQAECCSSD